MCGRYKHSAKHNPVWEHFDIHGEIPFEFVARYNIAPTQPIAVDREPHKLELFVFETMEKAKTIADHAASSVTKSLAQFCGPGRLAHAPQGTALCLSDTVVFALQIANFEP